MANQFSLDPRRVAKRLLRGEVYYAMGRFARVRRTYSRVRALRERVAGAYELPLHPIPLFRDCDAAQAVTALRRDSVIGGLELPPDILAELVAFAHTQPLVPLQGGPAIVKSDVRNGRLPTGEPAVVGRIVNAAACPAVRRVAYDPALVAIARSFLGYVPPIVFTELHWSFVSDASPDYRRQLGQTIDYHYDTGWFNFLYMFFYLTDCDRRCGAHALIRGSHAQKPFKMLLHSARQPDEAVLEHYGAASELIIEGPAGSGFIEDASCFHKALIPESRERLAFFVRYG
jgi:hypothetical protein